MTDTEFLDWVACQVPTATQFVFFPLEVSERLDKLAYNTSRLYAIRRMAGTGSFYETKWSGGHVLYSVAQARRILVEQAVKRLTS